MLKLSFSVIRESCRCKHLDYPYCIQTQEIEEILQIRWLYYAELHYSLALTSILKILALVEGKLVVLGLIGSEKIVRGVA